MIGIIDPKKIWQNSTSIYDKLFQQTMNSSKYPQTDERDL